MKNYGPYIVSKVTWQPQKNSEKQEMKNKKSKMKKD